MGKICWSRKWQPTPGFLPGNSMDRGAWWATVHGAAESRTQLSDRAHNITADSKLYVFPMYNLMMYSGRMMYHTEDNKHTTLSLPSHPWLPRQPLICCHFVFICQNFHKWNHSIGTLFCLSSFMYHNICEIHPCCSMYKGFYPFYCWISFICTPVWLPIYLLMDTSIISNLGLL